MAKVHFAPNSAIKYVGAKSKEFVTSLARPKPVLKKGDIIIVDKKTAFNLVTKGFGEFENVESVEFVKADVTTSNELTILNAENEALKKELAEAIELLVNKDDETESKESLVTKAKNALGLGE